MINQKSDHVVLSRSNASCACDPEAHLFTGPSLACSSSSSCFFDCYNFASPTSGACRKYGVWELMEEFESSYLASGPPSGCQRIDFIDPANCLSHFGGNYNCLVFKSCEIFHEDVPRLDPGESKNDPFFNVIDLCELLNGRLAKFIECYQSRESILDCGDNATCNNLQYYPILDFHQVEPPCGPCATGNPYDVWMTILKVDVYCCP